MIQQRQMPRVGLWLGCVMLGALAATAQAEFANLLPERANVLEFPPQNVAFVRVAILATTGTPQSATVGTTYAIPLPFDVTDANANPVPGLSVSFNLSFPIRHVLWRPDLPQGSVDSQAWA